MYKMLLQHDTLSFHPLIIIFLITAKLQLPNDHATKEPGGMKSPILGFKDDYPTKIAITTLKFRHVNNLNLGLFTAILKLYL